MDAIEIIARALYEDRHYTIHAVEQAMVRRRKQSMGMIFDDGVSHSDVIAGNVQLPARYFLNVGASDGDDPLL